MDHGGNERFVAPFGKMTGLGKGKTSGGEGREHQKKKTIKKGPREQNGQLFH